MTYVSPWERLADARDRVMAATGSSREDAEAVICRAIADGPMNLRAKLKRHTTRQVTAASTVLERVAFQISPTLDRENLDWEHSCPRKPWLVNRGHFSTHGYWELEWIELSRADVTQALCAPPGGDVSTRSPPSLPDAADISRTKHCGLPAAARFYAKMGEKVAKRRRGPRPEKLERVVEAMRESIQQGRLSDADLDRMREKTLADTYGVSRDTVRKAREKILREFAEGIPRQIATNDK